MGNALTAVLSSLRTTPKQGFALLSNDRDLYELVFQVFQAHTAQQQLQMVNGLSTSKCNI